MKVSEGFSMADSRNLPKVDLMMLLEYMRENDSFNVAEIRGAKVMMSSRDSYVETSVGYVEVKRQTPLCYVKGRVTPEHKVRCKLYAVTAVIDEVEDAIKEVHCEDCAASEGGCKHSICFVTWLIKHTEAPSVTSTICYWTKPKLSEAVSEKKFLLAKEMGKRKLPVVLLPPSLRLSVFLDECKKRKIRDSLLTNYNRNDDVVSWDQFMLFQIMIEFVNNHTEQEINFPKFKQFAYSNLGRETISAIEKETRGQATNILWHTLKQGRVSASRIYEASRCKTDGVLVKSILGGYKVPETRAIKRGKLLEAQVVKEIENKMNLKIHSCGFQLITPFIGASPDGLNENFIVEIKCPSSEQAIRNNVKNGDLTDKFKAQVQLQMHAMHKKKGLFCVADPKFEENKKILIYWQYYDRLYVEQLLRLGEKFWETFIFEKLLNIVK